MPREPCSPEYNPRAPADLQFPQHGLRNRFVLLRPRRSACQARTPQSREIQKQREQRAAREQKLGQHVRAEAPGHLQDGREYGL
jgi:hypothetical protein